MSRDITLLAPEMQPRINAVVSECAEAGFYLLVYCTYRDPFDQARLYRQGRSYKKEILPKIVKFRDRGQHMLARIIESVGPQMGSLKRTNAAPGESWHGYGLAVDAVPVQDGKLCWSVSQNLKLYEAYGSACANNGLNWSGNWKSFKEFAHCQLASAGNPLKVMDTADALDRLQIAAANADNPIKSAFA